MAFQSLLRRRRPTVTTTPYTGGDDVPQGPSYGPVMTGDDVRSPTSGAPMLGMTPSQRRGMQSNLLKRRRAATFAASMPTPSPIALNDLQGNPTGQYDHSGPAHREAYIASNNLEADLLQDELYGAGYADNNARANVLTGAEAAVKHADANRLNAVARVGIPGEAEKNRGAGQLSSAQAARTTALTPYETAGAGIANEHAAALTPYIGPTAQADMDRKRAETDAYRNNVPFIQGQDQQLRTRIGVLERMLMTVMNRSAKPGTTGDYLPSTTPAMAPIVPQTAAKEVPADREIPTMNSADDAANLTEGSLFYDPSGRLRRRPAAKKPLTPYEEPTTQPTAGAAAGPQMGQTATNRSTGQRIRWNGQAWEPI